MPRFTPMYGLPFERPQSDQPGITLDGGQDETQPILAEHVEGELERVDQDIAGVQDQLSAAAVTLNSIDDAGVPDAIFSDIPQTYRHLEIIWEGNATGPSPGLLAVRFNGDASDSYNSQVIDYILDSQTIAADSSIGSMRLGRVGAPNTGGGRLTIPNYHGGGNLKTCMSTGMGSTSGKTFWHQGSGIWLSTAAVTSVELFVPGLQWDNIMATLIGVR